MGAFLYPGCRSPPAPSRFPQKIWTEEKLIEITIQIDGQAVSVEVTVEVYEYLDRSDHKEENLAHEQRRHWDGRELDEYIVLTEGRSCYYMTPEQYVCHKETMQDIHVSLMLCTVSQRRRFLLYALEDMSIAEIGRVCSCSKVSVFESIQAVRRKVKKFLAGHPNESIPYTPQMIATITRQQIGTIERAIKIFLQLGLIEQMFYVVDSRYRSRKPMIITINLRLEEIKNPLDLPHARIYDRILERCAPILFAGKNFRGDNAEATRVSAKGIVSQN